MPTACMGVKISPSTKPLRMVAVKGSRCMITAVRNAPMRTVERNTNRIAAVVAKLSAMRQVQARLDCGMVQAGCEDDAGTKMMVADSIEYQVVSRASAPTR